jgi:hypothetical protein
MKRATWVAADHPFLSSARQWVCATRCAMAMQASAVIFSIILPGL